MTTVQIVNKTDQDKIHMHLHMQISYTADKRKSAIYAKNKSEISIPPTKDIVSNPFDGSHNLRLQHPQRSR